MFYAIKNRFHEALVSVAVPGFRKDLETSHHIPLTIHTHLVYIYIAPELRVKSAPRCIEGLTNGASSL